MRVESTVDDMPDTTERIEAGIDDASRIHSECSRHGGLNSIPVHPRDKTVLSRTTCIFRGRIKNPGQRGNWAQQDTAHVLKRVLQEMPDEVLDLHLPERYARVAKSLKHVMADVEREMAEEDPRINSCPACHRDLEEGEIHSHLMSCSEA